VSADDLPIGLDERHDPLFVARVGPPMYFAEIRSMISQAASPSSHSTTLPRTMIG
jgi:hypothetical protein